MYVCVYIHIFFPTANSLYFLSFIRVKTESKILYISQKMLYISMFCIENTSLYLF